MPDNNLQYKKVAIIDDILVNDVQIDGQSIVANKIANIDATTMAAIVQEVVALMQGKGITISENKINSNILYEEIGGGGAESPIVGTGLVGSMVIA